MSESAELGDMRPKGSPEKSLRRAARLVGLVLTSALFLPWGTGQSWDPEWKSVWEAAELTGSPHLVALPLFGVFFLVAGFAPRLSLPTRRFAMGVGGLLVVLVGFHLLGTRSIGPLREFRRVGVVGTYVLLSATIVTVAADVAMHQRPRVRGLSIAALAGWVLFLGALFVPIGPHGELDESVLAGLFGSLGRRGLFDGAAMVGCWFIALTLLGIGQAARRVGRDRDVAAARAFRTSWVAYLVMPVPLFLGYAFTAGAVVSQSDDALRALNWVALPVGVLAGGALGLGHGLAGLTLSPRWFRRGTLAIAILALLSWGVRSLRSTDDPSRYAPFFWAMAEATTDVLAGAEVERKYLGGYEEFDLRSARGMLREQGELKPVLYAVNVTGAGGAWLVIPAEGAPAWVNGEETGEYLTSAELANASPMLADVVEAAAEGMLDGCLPEPEGAFPGPFFVSPTPACGSNRYRSRHVQTFGGYQRSGGNVDRYRLVVEAEGRLLAFEGSFNFQSGRLWIGPPRPAAD